MKQGMSMLILAIQMILFSFIATKVQTPAVDEKTNDGKSKSLQR